MSTTEMRTLYDNIVKTLAPHVDILLCETLSSSREAQAAATAAKRAQPGLDMIAFMTHLDIQYCH